jgi:hypothetical protein
MKRSILALFVASTSVLFGQFGQLNSNSISITASRVIYVQPDQVAFYVSVSSGPDATLTDILNALAGAGVTASEFTGAISFYDATPGQTNPWSQNWAFSVPVPFSKMKETAMALASLQQTIAQKNSGLSVSVGLPALSVSPELQASQKCSNRDLVADARAQAEKLASAAGLAVGSILSIAPGGNLVGVGVPGSGPNVGYISEYVSVGKTGTGITSTTTNGSQASSLSCSLQVEFAVVR